jgi:tetratricopeptide (TPR) repeat protein
MEPLRTDARPAEALSDVERDARIEQLLLSGLDEYFAHRYESAINLWTRVLFFDRHHDRARAYIERARRAQAERQRESEAALHQGIEAFRAGDVARARELVAAALDKGASPDEAHGMLERIDRLGVAQVAPKSRRRHPAVTASASLSTSALPGESGRPSRVRGWLAALLLTAAAVGMLAVGTLGLTVPEPARWAIFSSEPSGAGGVVRWTPEPLPVPRASEGYLSRARSLAATGRLQDALAALDRVSLGDPLYDEAARLRGDIQQQLLTLAAIELSRSSTRPGAP